MALTAGLKRRVTALDRQRSSSTEEEDRIKESAAGSIAG